MDCMAMVAMVFFRDLVSENLLPQSLLIFEDIYLRTFLISRLAEILVEAFKMLRISRYVRRM